MDSRFVFHMQFVGLRLPLVELRMSYSIFWNDNRFDVILKDAWWDTQRYNSIRRIRAWNRHQRKFRAVHPGSFQGSWIYSSLPEYRGIFSGPRIAYLTRISGTRTENAFRFVGNVIIIKMSIESSMPNMSMCILIIISTIASIFLSWK